MDPKQARIVLEKEANPPIGRLTMAVAVMCSPEQDKSTTIDDLLLWLEKAHAVGRRNQAVEILALALYRRTGRKRSSYVPYEDFVVDFADWQNYVKNRHK